MHENWRLKILIIVREYEAELKKVVNQGLRGDSFMKKTEGRKSCDTGLLKLWI
jgi:acetone carboxylase gamma subunit